MTQARKVYPLVLLGGGHSHALWLKSWRASWKDLVKSDPLKSELFAEQAPLLISEKTTSPYSGMLPGLLAGSYQFDDCHIDLKKLCQVSQCEFLQRQCINIQVVDADKPLYRLDFAPSNEASETSENLDDSVYCSALSINIGSQPFSLALESSLTTNNLLWKIKPISQFYQHWQKLQQGLAELQQNNQSLSSQCIRIIGAGAAGVEIACAIKIAYPDCQVHLVSNSETVLPTFNPKLQTLCLRQLKKMNITFIANNPLTEEELSESHNILCTHSSAPQWLPNTSLKLSNKGFINVDENLETSLKSVFAVGDCAHFSSQPLAKAGVYAVRQTPTLLHNVCARLNGKALVNYQPQAQFLSIINMGNRYALGQRGRFSWHGRWLWHYKHYLDRSFMSQFL